MEKKAPPPSRSLHLKKRLQLLFVVLVWLDLSDFLFGVGWLKNLTESQDKAKTPHPPPPVVPLPPLGEAPTRYAFEEGISFFVGDNKIIFILQLIMKQTPFSLKVALPKAFPSGGRGTASAVDEVSWLYRAIPQHSFRTPRRPFFCAKKERRISPLRYRGDLYGT